MGSHTCRVRFCMSCMMATAVSESSPEVGSSSMSTCKPSAPLSLP